MASLDKAALFARRQLQKVTLSEGGEVWIKKLTAEVIVNAQEDSETFSTRCISMALCDEKGAPLFGDDDRDEVKLIAVDDFGIIFKAIMEQNGFNKPNSDAEKNSETRTVN